MLPMISSAREVVNHDLEQLLSLILLLVDSISLAISFQDDLYFVQKTTKFFIHF